MKNEKISKALSRPEPVNKSNVPLALLCTGLSLYAGEGTKRGSTVDFANMDVKIIKVWLKFIRTLGVRDSRIRIRVKTNKNLKQKDERFWSEKTKIPLTQFNKAWLVDSKNHRDHGVCYVRVNDKNLLKKINFWVSELFDQFLGDTG